MTDRTTSPTNQIAWRRRWRGLWEPWLLAVAATPLLGVALTVETGAGAKAVSEAGAAFLFGATAAFVAYERLRKAAVEMFVESIIGTAALVFLAWGLDLQHPVPSGDQRPASLVAFAASVLSVCVLVAIGWLLSIDRGARRLSLGLLAAASGALALASATGARGGDPGSWSATMADASMLAALVLGGCAVAHTSRRQLRMPALELQRGHVARRAAVTLGAVLVGPLLLIVPLAADTLSLPFVAAVTALLTLLAVAHVYRLLQRWGALEHDVHHDGLTGLPNRQYFNQRLHLAIEHARTEDHELAVLFLDLDHFKQVNDNLGHAAGNALLTKVAARLRSVATGDLTVARLGGDEFALLVPLPRGRGLARDTISRTLETFAVPIEVARRMLYVSPSIGVAYYPADGRDASTLLERADAEMYKVKTRRRAARGDQGVTTLPLEPTQDIELALRRAINEERLVLHYQPKVDLTTGRATGVEALLRWRHPAGGLLLPQDFLPIAEENGMMPALAEWVLLEACAQSRRWLDFNVAAVRVAVNLSPSQLKAGRVPELVERVLRFTKLPPELLELEVDERATQLHVETLRADLVALRDLGVRCVIDDFGGVGSLQYLEDLPFDAIELGRRHARAITAGGGRVVTAALAMGRALGIETVVEGVETPDQLAFLQEHGCAIAQGHLLGGPAAGDEIEHYLTGLVSEGPAIRAVNEP